MKRLICPDLSIKNDVLRLPPSTEVGCVLAGACLIADIDKSETQELMFDSLVVLVQAKSPRARHWLLVGDDSWQPNTRIVKYNRLWRILAKRVQLPEGLRSEEFMIQSEEGIKYFGFIECKDIESNTLIELLKTERSCTLLASMGTDLSEQLKSIARTGWSRTTTFRPPLQILQMACQADLLVYQLVGDFDDREKGSALIGKASSIDMIFGTKFSNNP
jgi:hypothetical protein